MPREVQLNVLVSAYILRCPWCVRPPAYCVVSLGIIRGVCEVWGKSGRRGLNTCVVDYESLRMALLQVVVWVSEDCGAGLRVPGLVSGLGGLSPGSAVRLDVLW